MWGDPVFIEDWGQERGQGTFYPDTGEWWIHPRDMLIQRGRGRLPFESRMNLGMRELERDRRRHG